ncbi:MULTISPECIES: type II toxin-antitoxin system VapC family toxin [unclassified Cyanobium]|uniref:type II toxin-antitoxin system VapC family toxin n=1 Tax=unclassified Cyanobium TaxID=2627006 RepID=UPI0020CD9C62|nr:MULTISPECIES: type II toxin-antitoxin system VapC family toxin [unclassified Cyanobium]MCP9832777.1 type II toxin-antitoxin system VapC family toxin [Cyanobium sp. La Preciosa 7G6]MCP9935527.1 type II toxin-antitoxin system VapC family toxin [Cyanobium sp. Aljojuca 7A6]
MAAGYLIDTKVISELHRREPEARVVQWFEQRPSRQLALRSWLEQQRPAFFSGRVLPIDAAITHRWGRFLAEMGRTLPAIDCLLAATALEHNLVLITRNLRDVANLPLMVVNPWQGEGEP